MKKKLIIALCFFMVVISVYSQERYEILVSEPEIDKKLVLDDYYLCRNIYFDFFVSLKIDDELSINDTKTLFKKIIENTCETRQQEITINGKERIFIRIKPIIINNQENLVVYSNYNVKTKLFEKDFEQLKDLYAKRYMIVNDKIIDAKKILDDIEERKLIDDWKNTNQYNKIADHLINYSVNDNIQDIITTLNMGINNNSNTIEDTLLLNFSYLEYFLKMKEYKDFENKIYEIGVVDGDSDFIQDIIRNFDRLKQILVGIE